MSSALRRAVAVLSLAAARARAWFVAATVGVFGGVDADQLRWRAASGQESGHRASGDRRVERSFVAGAEVLVFTTNSPVRPVAPPPAPRARDGPGLRALDRRRCRPGRDRSNPRRPLRRSRRVARSRPSPRRGSRGVPVSRASTPFSTGSRYQSRMYRCENVPDAIWTTSTVTVTTKPVSAATAAATADRNRARRRLRVRPLRRHLDVLIDPHDDQGSEQSDNRPKKWHNPQALAQVLTNPETGRPGHSFTRRRCARTPRTPLGLPGGPCRRRGPCPALIRPSDSAIRQSSEWTRANARSPLKRWA